MRGGYGAMNTVFRHSLMARGFPGCFCAASGSLCHVHGTNDHPTNTTHGVWITNDDAPGTAQGACGTVEDAPRAADRESDRKDGDWNRGHSAIRFQQDEMLDQPDHQFFLIGLAFGHQQCQRHQGVVIDQLLYRFRQQVLVNAQVP